MMIPLEDVLDAHPFPITGVLHLGAHLGEEAAAYAAAGIRNVWWVEANPKLMDELIHNTRHMGHSCICALVSDADDEAVTFHVANNGQSSSVLELGTHAVVSPTVHYVGTQEHRTVTVDTLAETYNIEGCNFMNLDLQGYELHALEGAERFLEHVDVVYTECNLDELYRGCVLLPQLEEWLGERGFKRHELVLAGDQERGGEHWIGWGDVVFTR